MNGDTILKYKQKENPGALCDLTKITPAPLLPIKVVVTGKRFRKMYLQNDHIYVTVHTVV